MYVERVIGLLKNRYTILEGPLPIILIKSWSDESGKCEIPNIDKLVNVCAALVNLSTGIVYTEKKNRIENLYIDKVSQEVKTCSKAAATMFEQR